MVAPKHMTDPYRRPATHDACECDGLLPRLRDRPASAARGQHGLVNPECRGGDSAQEHAAGYPCRCAFASRLILITHPAQPLVVVKERYLSRRLLLLRWLCVGKHARKLSMPALLLGAADEEMIKMMLHGPLIGER